MQHRHEDRTRGERNTQPLRDRADHAMAMGDPGTAARLYRRLAKLAPRDLELSRRLARALETWGRADLASAEQLRMAGLYMGAGRPRRALAAVERALELEASSVVRHRLTAVVFRLGVQAEALCGRAIQAHETAGRRAEARDLMLLMVDADPGCAAKRMQLARMELGLGRTPQAVRHLRSAVKLYRASASPQFESAAELLLEHGGHDSRLLRDLIRIYMESDRYGRALIELGRLHRMVPSDLGVLEALARCQAEQGHIEDATSNLRRLVCLLRRGGSEDSQVCALLQRAHGWGESIEQRDAVQDLATRVLPTRLSSVTTTEEPGVGLEPMLEQAV